MASLKLSHEFELRQPICWEFKWKVQQAMQSSKQHTPLAQICRYAHRGKRRWVFVYGCIGFYKVISFDSVKFSIAQIRCTQSYTAYLRQSGVMHFMSPKQVFIIQTTKNEENRS